uniref:Protein phosphatase, Mg2+/Mn2+ dependent 1J n=1 Tax=Latimeria chalumnae TaxID=7897 RepID=H3BEG9_LATCH
MISKVKTAVSSFMGGFMPPSSNHSSSPSQSQDSESLPIRFPYCRPGFLDLTPEELQRSVDHMNRPILTPRETKRLPWNTGYAEVINAGKSAYNEDQACCEVVFVERRRNKKHNTESHASTDDEEEMHNLKNQDRKGIDFHYWALLDGHAGSGAAVMASKLLHLHICDQLKDVVDIIQNLSVAPPICVDGVSTVPVEHAAVMTQEEGTEPPNDIILRFHLEKEVSHESLVTGAIENAFKQMDAQIERERTSYCIVGGCCALAVVNLMGKLYVANAGDSRAIIIRNGEIIPMSCEFTPETERQRLQYLGYLKPELLGNEFTHIEFPRRIQHKELGKKMLFRDHTMTGWAYKTIQEDDLKFPLIYGEGKKARVMATIGVTRGLGDHDLKVYSSNIYIKPFLSCSPEVKVYDLTQYEHCPDDLLVLGTDGLWDVLDNHEVADIVTNILTRWEPNDPSRYTQAAANLVSRARGVLKERGWKLANDKLGSGDDISVFVIPLGGPCS